MFFFYFFKKFQLKRGFLFKLIRRGFVLLLIFVKLIKVLFILLLLGLWYVILNLFLFEIFLLLFVINLVLLLALVRRFLILLRIIMNLLFKIHFFLPHLLFQSLLLFYIIVRLFLLPLQSSIIFDYKGVIIKGRICLFQWNSLFRFCFCNRWSFVSFLWCYAYRISVVVYYLLLRLIVKKCCKIYTLLSWFPILVNFLRPLQLCRLINSYRPAHDHLLRSLFLFVIIFEESRNSWRMIINVFLL